MGIRGRMVGRVMVEDWEAVERSLIEAGEGEGAVW